MKLPHNWIYPSSIEQAKVSQRLMAEKVCLKDSFQLLKCVGGMDISNNLFDPQEIVYASAVTLSLESLEVLESSAVKEKQTFPYITGFLGFREAPSLVNAFKKLKTKPDVLLIDGHGVSHPRGLGIASHLGVLLDMPTIGVAKSILVGKPESNLGDEPGSCVPLVWKNQIVGMMLRTKKRANPVIISAGHRISLETALEIVKKCVRGYRIPEPTRQAHIAANHYRRLHM